MSDGGREQPPTLDSTGDSWSGLPARLRGLGDLTGSGELLWTGELAREVLDWLVGQGRGVIGGEVYVSVGKARGAFAGDWQTAPQWRANEDWQAFVERSAAQSRAEIAAREASVDASSRRFFLAAAERGSYPTYLRED